MLILILIQMIILLLLLSCTNTNTNTNTDVHITPFDLVVGLKRLSQLIKLCKSKLEKNSLKGEKALFFDFSTSYSPVSVFSRILKI